MGSTTGERASAQPGEDQQLGQDHRDRNLAAEVENVGRPAAVEVDKEKVDTERGDTEKGELEAGRPSGEQEQQRYRGPADVVPAAPSVTRDAAAMPRFAASGDAGEVVALLTVEGPPVSATPKSGEGLEPLTRRRAGGGDASVTFAARLDTFLGAQMQLEGQPAPASVAIGAMRFTPVASGSRLADSADTSTPVRDWFVEGPEPEVAALLGALRRFADAKGRSFRAGEATMVLPTPADVLFDAGPEVGRPVVGRPAGEPSTATEPGVARRRLVLRFRPRSD